MIRILPILLAASASLAHAPMRDDAGVALRLATRQQPTDVLAQTSARGSTVRTTPRQPAKTSPDPSTVERPSRSWRTNTRGAPR